MISNCVINLSPDKRRVFAEIFRVLAGESCTFSDVFSGRRVPTQLAHDPLVLGECLGARCTSRTSVACCARSAV